MNLYELNDALSDLAARAGADLSDEQLNDLVHEVARVLGVAE